MRKILLTGQIGAGKSTVLGLLESAQIFTISADDLVRKIYAEQPAVLNEISVALGIDLFTEAGELNKQKLASIIFSDVSAREKVELIVHPLVNQELERALAARIEPIVVYENAVMRDLNQFKSFDEVIYITAPRELRMQRLLMRGMSADDIERRMANEINYSDLPSNCFVIENDSDIEKLRRDIAEMKIELGIA